METHIIKIIHVYFNREVMNVCEVKKTIKTCKTAKFDLFVLVALQICASKLHLKC